ncbi:MAG TPA: alpha/beta fold hydrolase [Candidatus Limnocylindria bacterium]|jgi:pyruvate dehydrogenase E2 component (dihydrolipoamide acetyltransferase)
MRTTTIEVAGSRIRVIDDGAGEQSVLFVHGVGGWAENWSEAMERVAASGRRAVAFDLPGFGESTRVPGARYFDLRDPFYPAVVDGVRRALGLGRPHLVGHSLGGGIAGVTSVVHPAAWRSLTLVAPGGFGPDIALFLRVFSLPFLGVTTWLPRPASAGRAVLESCFSDRARIPAHLYVESARYDRTYPETLRVMRAVATFRGVRRSLRETWLARAGEYAGPVLVVWGKQDGIIPAAHLRALQETYPKAELKVIADAGHLVMAEQPDAFAATLLPFLERAERAPDGARTMEPGVAHQER